MKKFLIFLAGVIVGIGLTVLYPYFNKAESDNTNVNEETLQGLTMFSEKGDCVKTTSRKKSAEIEINQVVKSNMALGTVQYYSDQKLYGGEFLRSYDYDNKVVVLLTNDEGKTYYDDQKIDVSNKCLRQIGTFEYTSRGFSEKTVPVVVIE